MVENLLLQAHRAAPQQSLIIVRANAAGDIAVVSVQDQGPGIPHRDRERIFERFHPVERSARGDSGLGLGLWISRSLVERYGGDIVAANRPAEAGGGAELRVLLLSDPEAASLSAD